MWTYGNIHTDYPQKVFDVKSTYLKIVRLGAGLLTVLFIL